MAGPNFGPGGEQGHTIATIQQANGGYDIITSTGAVYAENGAQYYGGTNTGIGGAPGENIVSAVALAGGGYQLINAQGQTYNFGTGAGQYNATIGGYNPTPQSPAGSVVPAGSQDAWASLQAYFQALGVSDPSAMSWAQGLINSGASAAQVEVQMYDQPWFKTRFPEIGMAQANGLPPISPQDVLNYEQTVSQLEQQVGLPQGFISKAEITQLMGKYNVSVNELTDRLTQGYAQSQQAVANNPAVAAALQQYYGVKGGGLAAYWLDPTKALTTLQNQFTAAQIGGASTMAGFANLNQGLAQQMASFGVTANQASSGFQQLQHMSQAYNPTIGGVGGPGLTQQQLVAGQFLGNAADQQAMQLAAAQRQAAFQGGSNFTGTAQGNQGLGAAVPTR